MHDESFAIQRQNPPANVAKPLPVEIQPYQQYPNQVALPLCHQADMGHMGTYPQQWQNWQQPSGRLPLLIVVFLSGGLLGVIIGGLLGLAVAPRNPPPIINNPPADIINPDCRLFCGN